MLGGAVVLSTAFPNGAHKCSLLGSQVKQLLFLNLYNPTEHKKHHDGANLEQKSVDCLYKQNLALCVLV